MLNRGFVYTYRVKTVRNTNVVVSISESKQGPPMQDQGKIVIGSILIIKKSPFEIETRKRELYPTKNN